MKGHTNLVVTLGLAALACTAAFRSCTVAPKTTLQVANHTALATTVYVAFGADSAITARHWPACTQDTPNGLDCQFDLPAGATMTMPANGYLNATLAFGKAVGCGATKVELNLNNPKWYDIADVSLVDGFNLPVKVQFGAQTALAAGSTGNERAFGVYPFGCDICVARQSPPCGIAPSPTPGSAGCKQGTQYKPAVPCQLQGATMGGGNLAVVVSVEP